MQQSGRLKATNGTAHAWVTVPLHPYCYIETLGMQMNNDQTTYNSRTLAHNL